MAKFRFSGSYTVKFKGIIEAEDEDEALDILHETHMLPADDDEMVYHETDTDPGDINVTRLS